jgi:hypothetical protein
MLHNRLEKINISSIHLQQGENLYNAKLKISRKQFKLKRKKKWLGGS